MILGHWYLVTPRLPEAPLVLVSRRLLGSSRSRSCCSWPGSGSGPARVRGAIHGASGRLRARRTVGPVRLAGLAIGLVFPLIISWAAVETARTRSMESATGLLYIDVGAIAAGTILAAGLYFGAGLLTCGDGPRLRRSGSASGCSRCSARPPACASCAEVPVGATVDDAWDAVVGTVPALAPGRASLRFAVNGTYADPDTDPRRRRGGRLHPARERRPATSRCASSRSTRRRSRPTSS